MKSLFDCDVVAHEDIEIEIKVRVENVKPLDALMQKEGQFKGEVKQVDEYFTPAHVDYTSVSPVREWLRLRNEDGTFSINYKNYHFGADGKAEYCDEVETEVDEVGKVEKIFSAVGFRTLTRVEKLRSQWTYKDYEIAIDSVAGLGDFVEIEFNKKSVDPKKVTDDMMRFLSDLGVGKIQRSYQGYPFMLLFPDKVVYE